MGFPRVPDASEYKLENAPDLVRYQKKLASMGLKDPWIRNEIWRYDKNLWGDYITKAGFIRRFFFKGIHWGALGAGAAIGLELTWKYFNPPKDHGHH